MRLISKFTRQQPSSDLNKDDLHVTVDPRLGARASYELVPKATEKFKFFETEFWRAAIAFVLLQFAIFSNGLSLGMIHEQMPEHQPLPDVILDFVGEGNDNLVVPIDLLLIFGCLTTITMVVFHKNR